MKKSKECIVCKKTSQDVALLKFMFKGEKYHICSQHMPILIHKAESLESILPGIPTGEDD